MKINGDIIGARVSARRKELLMTQESLTDLADISTNQLSNIENGHCVPTIETIIKLSNALSVTPDYFLLGVIKDADGDIIKATAEKMQLCTEKQQNLVYEFVSLLINENY